LQAQFSTGPAVAATGATLTKPAGVRLPAADVAAVFCVNGSNRFNAIMFFGLLCVVSRWQ
jgi:hypothetical protein